MQETRKDVGRQVPSKQDDDAVLDGDKKAISTQYITLSYIKLCILYYSSVLILIQSRFGSPDFDSV